MPDYSIPQVQTQNPMNSIGSMMNIATGAQNLQRGAQDIELKKLELQKNDISLAERKGIQDLFRNPEQFNDKDGNPDYNKLINEGMKVAPTTFPTMVPQIIAAHKSSIDAKAALNSLNDQQRNSAAAFVGSLGKDTPDVARSKLDAFGLLNPQLKPALDFAWNHNLKPAAGNPEAWGAAVNNVRKGVMTPGGQIESETPSGQTVDSGAQTGFMNLKPSAGPTGIVQGTIVNKQLPLGERQTGT